MSKNKPTQITLEPDEHTLKTIELYAEVQGKTIKEVAEHFLLTGAINDSTQKVLAMTIEKAGLASKEQIDRIEKTIKDSIESMEAQLDSLEISVDKALERLD